jgi:multiple sugar transport system permease protein
MNRHNQKKIGRQWLGLGHYAVLVTLSFMCLAPLIVMFLTSFKTQTQIFSNPPVWFFMPTLDNYQEVLFEGNFDKYLINSLIVSIVSTVLTLLFGCMAAYAIVRFRFMGRNTVAWATLLLRTVPLAVLAVPVFALWNDWGLSGSLGGLILLYVAINLPFTIWVLYGFIDQVPYELEEAAMIDGCGPFRLFFTVLLPLIRPGLAAAAIFTFRIAWNEFVLALVLTDRDTRTLPVAASLYITDVGVEWGKITALGVLIALPPLIFTFMAAKQIISGLTAGAVKG